ncbi:mas-related G-protein coupled receptor member D-like [Equus asinus]|uniref:mas-related G-protein coupled receptor member D-like n=1 Tax=Equus asinus TaxID=9793 RepID=UPI00071A57E4|nr:mas-related G-protein coupled receptor member D-like [Equus asinus]
MGDYILHLVLADLFLLCSATLTVLDARSQVNHLGHRAVKSVKYLAYTAGLSLLTAASAQPCLSILFPTWYHSHRHTRLSGLECARLWLLSLMVTMLASFFHEEPGNPHLRQGPMVNTVFHILTLVGFTPIMVLSGVVLFIQLRKSSRPWQWQPTRLYVALLASVFVFLICALTVGIPRFTLHPLHPPQQTKTLFSSFECLLSSLSSDAKPIIYFLAGSRGSQSLREPLSAVLGRALQEEPEQEGKEMPSSGTNQVGVRGRGLLHPCPEQPCPLLPAWLPPFPDPEPPVIT